MGAAKSSSPAIVVGKSQNSKLGTMSATYVSQATCPKNCPFHGNQGCYAECGKTGIIAKRLNNSSVKDVRSIAEIEAEGIKNLQGLYPLRLHVVGDSPTPESARIVSEACEEFINRTNLPVFGYTHARIPRDNWGKVSILRSCTTLRQAEGSMQANYAAALVVSKFKRHNRYYIGRGMNGIPCPKQTGLAESCKSCKLCFQDELLKRQGSVILFEAHGAAKNRVKQKCEL